jgi:hypothetical protein
MSNQMKGPSVKIKQHIGALALIFAATLAQAGTISVDVTANVDGRDWLYLTADSLQFQHFDYQPTNAATVTTTLNGQVVLNQSSWTPSWPNGTGSGSTSQVFDFGPSLSDATLTGISFEQCRDSCQVIQQGASFQSGKPDIVEFNDDPSPGPGTYEVLYTFNAPVPESSTVIMLVAGLVLLGRQARRLRRRDTLRA